MNLILWPMATLIMNLTVVCVLWFGGNMVNAGDLEIGKIVALLITYSNNGFCSNGYKYNDRLLKS